MVHRLDSLILYHVTIQVDQEMRIYCRDPRKLRVWAGVSRSSGKKSYSDEHCSCEIEWKGLGGDDLLPGEYTASDMSNLKACASNQIRYM